MISGKNHWIIVGDEHEGSVIKFGQPDGSVPKDPDTKLSVNHKYTFRVDMNEVLRQLGEK